MTNSLPNIILLLSDNMRLDHLGCMGMSPCQTPVLDRIGRNGVIIENLRTTSPVCSPARASIFTGYYPNQAGVPCVIGSHLHELNHQDEKPLIKTPVISEHLQMQGYECLYAGKWHVGDQEVKRHFDLAVATDTGSRDYSAWCKTNGLVDGFVFNDPERSKPFRYHEPPGMTQPHSAILDFPEEHEYNLWMLNNAFELLERRNPKKPLFMVFSTFGIHPPLFVPREYYDMYDPAKIPHPSNFGPTSGEPSFLGSSYHRRNFEHWGHDFDSWRKPIAVSWGYMTYIDSLFGRFIERLNSTGVLDNALLTFTADHGTMFGQHGLNQKFCPYEEAVRVPWVMQWPGQIDPDTRCEMDMTLMDLSATILAAAGVEVDSLEIEGDNILPVVNNLQDSVKRDIFSEFTRPDSWRPWHGIEDWRSIFRRPWKLVVHENGEEELYNLDNDPGELVNVVDREEHSDNRKNLLESLLEWVRHTGDPFDPQPKSSTPV